MKATETIIEQVPGGVTHEGHDALCDYVLARYPVIIARLGEGFL